MQEQDLVRARVRQFWSRWAWGTFSVKLTAFVAVLFFLTNFSLAFAKERSTGGLDSGIPVVEENSNNDLNREKVQCLILLTEGLKNPES